MSKDSITKKVSERICLHMNKDHKDSLVKYAKYYGNIKDPQNVVMVELNSCFMVLKVDGSSVQISFDHNLNFF